MHSSISNFKSEQDVRKEIFNFFTGDQEIYLIELDLAREGQHILLVKSIYEKLESETMENWTCSKSICILGHMMRNVKYNNLINIMEGWIVLMFD